MESHACFKAVTTGIVLGRAVVYVTLAWGFTFISFGVNLFRNFMEFGTDPICFIGWDNEVKWHFFAPVITALGVGFILMMIVMCNLYNSGVRKTSIFEEISLLALGLMFTMFLYCLNWMFGVMALIRYPEMEIPNFFPIFQLFNSWSGVYVVGLLGLMSVRTRAVLTNGVKSRQEKILNAALEKKHVQAQKN